MKKLILILIFFTTFLFSNNEKKITLQLNWLHQFQFAGYYMAKEKGFYKDVGLDVNFKEFTFNKDNLENIKNGTTDFAIGRSSLLVEKINGEDIIALAAIFQNSPLMLLVKKDSNINTVKDLKNKKIMITSDASYSASILAMLSANGLKSTDYTILEHSSNLNDLIDGKVDAMASYLSNEPIILKDKNIEYKIFHPKDYGFDFYSDILFTSSEYIKNNEKTTKDFYDASIKGWKYAFENLIETAEIIYLKYNNQNKSFIHLLKEGEILKKLAFNEKNEIGNINQNKLISIVNIFKVFGLVNKDINPNSFIYDGNPHKTFSFEISHSEENFIIVILSFLFIIFCLAIYFFNKTSQIKELLHTVINSSDDLIFYKDCKLRYIGCNKSFERLIGKKESEIIGKTDSEIFDRNLSKKFRENDLEVLSANTILIKNEWLTFDNKQIFFQIKEIPFSYKKNKKNGILGIGRDITNLYIIQEKLKEQAYYDELTQIYNRKAYNERIQEKFDMFNRYQTYFCIATYDIDNFKHINDTYGHDIGDKVLIEMTNEIKKNIRKTDLLFRIGGEEFTIIFSKTLIQEAYDVIEKLRTNISNMTIIENERITISIGITEVKEDDTVDSIYERADKLMYKSKRNGKNQTTKD